MLVSKSPRRVQLLTQAGYQFEPFSLETSEIIDENLNCFDQCKRLACIKMEHFKDEIGLRYGDFKFALTCDTMVEFKGESLGKPESLHRAKKWLLDYSGKSQFVHTACCLLRLDGSGQDKSWVETTKINFKEVSESGVDEYLKNNTEVLGKAGGYGIQDETFSLVKEIEGSYTNVVGLPMESLKRELESWG